MDRLSVEAIVEQIDQVHAELADLTVRQFLGAAAAQTTADILQDHPLPTQLNAIASLRTLVRGTDDPEEAERLERILFGCMDLVIANETASLEDMVTFYMQRGRMHVGSDRIPAPEVVPWLQAEPDFSRREEMQKENSIFLKAIINPMLLGILELTVRAVTEKFGYADYASYCEAKKQTSFEREAEELQQYLEETRSEYLRRMAPWVEEVIGKPFSNLSRYHALYLIRIRKFDHFFGTSSLMRLARRTFMNLGFDAESRSDVIFDISDSSSKSPNGICLGVKIPGEIHVIMKPVGGLVDVEALLHETGHAFFLSHFDPLLPIEYRRLNRSSALDETFAFLFMNLIGNPAWLTGVAGMPVRQAEELPDLYKTKQFCLIRRYIGKFLAERELHERRDIKNPSYYCKHLEQATGFVYEPQGYLIDMEHGFYALDYLHAWAGSDVLARFLEAEYGLEWFAHPQAGAALRTIAASGRKNSLKDVLSSFCGSGLRLPRFAVA
jgi:hypothetical protein